MKAAILEELNRIVVRDCEMPTCGRGGGAAVHACAVCGSDLRIYRYGNDRVKPPP